MTDGRIGSLPWCCREYVLRSLTSMEEWIEIARKYDDAIVTPEDQIHAVEDQAAVVREILNGKLCPWHENPGYFIQIDDIIQMADKLT